MGLPLAGLNSKIYTRWVSYLYVCVLRFSHVRGEGWKSRNVHRYGGAWHVWFYPIGGSFDTIDPPPLETQNDATTRAASLIRKFHAADLF